MSKTYISPFKPKIFNKYHPKLFNIYTFNAGFKKNRSDLLVIEFNQPVPFAAAYTKSSTPSAPIIWAKKFSDNYCKLLIVNSGNANAHTGKKGLDSIQKYVKFAAKIFKCKLHHILVSSTGVIGEQLNSNLIISALSRLSLSSKKNILDAALSIMTTDTYPKISKKVIIHRNQKIKIYGIAKGSGMVAPKMGTMLSYIFIESNIKTNDLRNILKENIEPTFNSISVDGDTSTNDTVMIFSVGDKKVQKIDKKLKKKISEKIFQIMLNLSKQIVSDGEGISKLIEVNVINAKNDNQAKNIGFSVANSLLVKTAVSGEDANWGRVVMAIGKKQENIKQEKIIIKFGNLIVAKNGMVYKKINISSLNKYMKNKIIKININLNIGKYKKTVWSSDLTHKYIEINSDYRS